MPDAQENFSRCLLWGGGLGMDWEERIVRIVPLCTLFCARNLPLASAPSNLNPMDHARRKMMIHCLADGGGDCLSKDGLSKLG